MAEYLVEQWCALVQKMEEETSRFLSRYHYFFGYSGAALGLALSISKMGGHSGTNATSPDLAAIAVSLSLMVACGTAIVALIMVWQGINTRWLWRQALQLIEAAVLNGAESEFVKREHGEGPKRLFFPAFTRLGEWKSAHSPKPTEWTMLVVAIVWVVANVLLLFYVLVSTFGGAGKL